jgi:hypothetical protein
VRNRCVSFRGARWEVSVGRMISFGAAPSWRCGRAQGVLSDEAGISVGGPVDSAAFDFAAFGSVEFHSNPRRYFTLRAMVLRSYRAMAAPRRRSATVPARNARSDQNRRSVAASRSPRSQRRDLRAKTARVALMLSLFLVVLAAALFIGGRKVIGPLLREAAAQTREAHRKGDIVFTMPDGTFCRHLAFDNKTAELRESTVLQCQEARPRTSVDAPHGFAWGAR